MLGQIAAFTVAATLVTIAPGPDTALELVRSDAERRLLEQRLAQLER